MQVLENFSLGPGKVLDFLVSKRVGTLDIRTLTECLIAVLYMCLQQRHVCHCDSHVRIGATEMLAFL